MEGLGRCEMRATRLQMTPCDWKAAWRTVRRLGEIRWSEILYHSADALTQKPSRYLFGSVSEQDVSASYQTYFRAYHNSWSSMRPIRSPLKSPMLPSPSPDFPEEPLQDLSLGALAIRLKGSNIIGYIQSCVDSINLCCLLCFLNVFRGKSDQPSAEKLHVLQIQLEVLCVEPFQDECASKPGNDRMLFLIFPAFSHYACSHG